MITLPKIRSGPGAMVIALALALGYLSASLSLVLREPDVCETECCMAAGHCCCATRHAYVKGHEPKPGEVSLNLENRLNASCPAICSGSTTSAQHYLPRATPASSAVVMIATGLFPPCRAQIPTGHPFAARPSVPRAPPLHHGLVA